MSCCSDAERAKFLTLHLSHTIMEQLGKILIFIGIILIIAGLIVYFAGKLTWLGHLPGDIRIVRDNVRFYFPVTTMIIISLIISVILSLIRKFLH